ncbi:alkaline phosphatase family protein [Paenibacillus peoriae]|uniref:alkaline phosphatase family protein n=1 Tax=Paenibacillus peoriae TaxID=59893 RepID=UPI00026C5B70|nr:alkaline phosphatase family protein [Paenibacillus peoriae]MEC0183189.1 alkaline phosphatase family protein [Paenibacillus peoriae]
MRFENKKLIVVVLDGLRYEAAKRCMGYMEHLVEQGIMFSHKVRSELPSNSRPLYEVLLTGTPACKNGITANNITRLSREKSVFHLASENRMTTAAAAYHWVSELYNKTPFNPSSDRHQHNSDLPIQHGIFYYEDHYPDSHLLADAEYLRTAYDPDFLYIHSMNIDDIGHKYGGSSKEYSASVRNIDTLLAEMMPEWLQKDYWIIVTADHGMNDEGQHGGTTTNERFVPLYINSSMIHETCGDQVLAQLGIAGLMCHCMGVTPSSSMKQHTLVSNLN